MLKIIKRVPLSEFDTWAGASDVVKYLSDNELDLVGEELAEIYPHGMDATVLNDFIWFEADLIAEWLGYSDFDEIIER